MYDKDQPECFEIAADFVKFLQRKSAETGRKIVFITEAYTSKENMQKCYNLGVDLPFNFSFINLNALNVNQIKCLSKMH